MQDRWSKLLIPSKKNSHEYYTKISAKIITCPCLRKSVRFQANPGLQLSPNLIKFCMVIHGYISHDTQKYILKFFSNGPPRVKLPPVFLVKNAFFKWNYIDAPQSLRKQIDKGILIFSSGINVSLGLQSFLEILALSLAISNL